VSLSLREPKYNPTAAYCHFGREPYELDGKRYFCWENPVDLSQYATLDCASVQAEVEAQKEALLTKWVD